MNFRYIYEHGLNDQEFMDLMKIHKKENDFVNEKSISTLEKLGLVKSGKITNKGKTFIQNAFLTKLTSEAEDLAHKLVDLYNQFDRKTGNFLEVKKRIAWFLDATMFNPEVIYNTIESYLNQNDKFVKNLDNLFWTPTSKAFSVHYKLSESPLFDMISKRYGLDQTKIERISKSKILKYMVDVVKLDIPKKGVPYFTGSYEKDEKFRLWIKTLLIKELRK